MFHTRGSLDESRNPIRRLGPGRIDASHKRSKLAEMLVTVSLLTVAASAIGKDTL